MSTPALMPRHRPPRDLPRLLHHPGLIVAWRGPQVTLRVGNDERTIDTRKHPAVYLAGRMLGHYKNVTMEYSPEKGRSIYLESDN